MTSQIFDSLLKEKINIFKSAFTSTAKEVFYDESKKRIFHNGEFGTYRETIVRDFLRFVVPSAYEISTGFVISSLDDISTQCDIIIYDANMTPIFEGADKQRFFPVETVHAIGEVKSTLNKSQFKGAINKLARNKALSERLHNPPSILKKVNGLPYNPIEHHMDLIPSFLICQKLAFDIDKLSFNELYDDDIEYRHRHNFILSIEDGLFAYFDEERNTYPYSSTNNVHYKNRVLSPDVNEHGHFMGFASFMFMVTTQKTLFYPEISKYMGSVKGCLQRDQM
ncbi:hypothetical protein MID13_05860 [Vibrio gigantis]|uniref:DUF6602 domain-containing protein n=1 Tax=Vibrio gigantis TaxID=296199 RepID=UPI001EFB4CF4|nr:DUF6602 domain-containing protein [Vibrio gigantis]ULN65329.1 hypothetical protein MID13_05860 [Vibrio gigantis]